MAETIEGLEPIPVWRAFHRLTQIPRPSHHEAEVRQFLVDFGTRRGFETLQDEAGNVIIRKAASPGREQQPRVTLQGHMDMVPQANSGTRHDFTRDPISTRVEDGWVSARETTLGADNGIGVAAMLAVLDATDLEHGPLETLFTSNEEDGMDGAFALRPETLTGKLLINTDAEDEGVLCIGCAGGANATTGLNYAPDPVPQAWQRIRLNISGLRGGHSGVDIHRGRANAVLLLFRFLSRLQQKLDLRILSVDAGTLRNAIPREAFAQIALAPSEYARLSAMAEQWQTEVAAEYATADPDLRLRLEPGDAELDGCLDPATASKLINAVYVCPNGVMRMSDNMPGLVESSNNLAIVRAGGGEVRIDNLVRSSVDSSRDELCMRIASLFSLIGAETRFDGRYPGWQPDTASHLLKRVKRVYRQRFGQEPEVGAIHAGLECGILGASHPGVQMISFGPTIRFPHSPDERVNVDSVQRFWQLLTGVLADV